MIVTINFRFVKSLLTMMLIFMSVATGGLVGTEEGQEHRSAVLCLSRAPDTKTLARSGRVS